MIFRLALDVCYRYSILPALSLDGIEYVDILEGSFTAASFAIFIEGLLDQMSPYPANKSVIIMDNCRIHKSPEILEMIVERSVVTSIRLSFSDVLQGDALRVSTTIFTRL